jgi:SAM-dependent methyltransferase
VTQPATWGRRRTVLDWLDRVRLARPTVRLYEMALAVRSRTTGPRTDEGLPLPPALLRARSGPQHADAAFFLRSGRRHAELIRELLAENGTDLETLDALLDFGCGCGRVLRHWSALDGMRRCGCDVHDTAVAWCSENLPFAEVSLTGTSPPLPYADDSFDLAYALSVFTHLTEEAQHAWVSELTRTLRPGGYLVISTLGEHYLSLGRLTEPEEQAFREGTLVVLYGGSSGSSLCSAYHPPEYVRTTLSGDLDVVGFRPAVGDGGHDLHLLRKPA